MTLLTRITRRRAAVLAIFLAAGGASLFGLLLANAGIAEVAGALKTAGWGLLGVVALHLVPMAADTVSWRYLIAREHRPGFARLLGARWIGEAVNALLPAAQVGGDILRARLAIFAGTPGTVAIASVVADITLGILALVVFILMGLGLLVWRLGEGAGALTGPALAGAGIVLVGVGAFYAAQRAGLFSVAVRLAARFVRWGAWDSLVERAGEVDRTVADVYGRCWDLTKSFVWALVAWILGAGEVWLALTLLGHPVSIVDALVLESVAVGVRSVLFVVPGALGVQEGGLILVAGLLGIPPETALALSLAKRARDILWGAPGLLAWQALEGRRLWRRRDRKPSNPGES